MFKKLEVDLTCHSERYYVRFERYNQTFLGETQFNDYGPISENSIHRMRLAMEAAVNSGKSKVEIGHNNVTVIFDQKEQ